MTDSKVKKRFGKDAKVLWQDRKRWCGLPLSFTRYCIVEKPEWLKLFNSIGFLTVMEDEVNFYRIFDVAIYQNLLNKIFGVGTITLFTNDESNPQVRIIRVKDPYLVKDLISERVEQERKKRRVNVSEFKF